MMTREAAWMSFDEQETSSLEAGKSADMVILSRNPLSSSHTCLKDITVEKLLLKGREWTGAGTVSGALLRAFAHRGC
jgi:predicted amidohydrolase YtcJ